jgi:branched-chain amino acid transport system substrate-binding protein
LYLSQYHTKVPVRLITYDDQTQGAKAAANIQHLVKVDKVNALLGTATPPLTIPASLAADDLHMPIVSGMTPIRAFLSGRPKWTYAWDMFFDELDMTQQQFLTMNTVNSNHRIALFTDTELDGVVMGGLWEKNAAKFGYTIAYHAKFPVGTTDYAKFIQEAQDSESQIIIAQMETPDAIALWQQMKKMNYRPAAAFLEKAAEPVEWTSALHADAQGAMVAGYWFPTLPYPGVSELRQRFELDTGLTYGQHIADTYTIAQILMDAIGRAGNLDPEAINKAIGQTNKTYVVGPVNFAKGAGGHTSALPSFMVQWQHGQTQIVYPPKLATAKLVYPLPAWTA